MMLVFDITDRQSFDEIRYKYIEQVFKYCKEGVQLAIIGNKCDMIKSRAVSYEEGQYLAGLIGALYFEVSAKEHFNIDIAFSEVIQAAVSKMKSK